VCWDDLLSAASNSSDADIETDADSTFGNRHGHGRDGDRDGDRVRTACPRLYGHEGRLEGVWGVEPFICDGQTALASVSSDGTFRCAFASTLNPLQSLRFNDGRDRGNRSSKRNGMGNADRGGERKGYVTVTASRTLDQWLLEAFRIHSVTTRHSTPTNSDDSSACRERDTEGGGWTGSVATICVDRAQHLDVQSDMVTRNVPSVAMHALHSIPYPYPYPLPHSFSNPRPHPTCRLMAYGGAAGVLRVHSLDMHEDITH
jgi:hypothetical protein